VGQRAIRRSDHHGRIDLGSGDPIQAGAAQLLVLVGLLAAETVAVLVTVELIARGRIRRDTT
jgi:putative ABC transport system permease protein